MAASDDDGGALAMVLEHLKDVKLQSEERLYALSTELKQVTYTLQESTQRQARLEDELDFRQSQIEELRRQQSQKHRLEVLDDWKALVGQLQADRKRLEGEVDRLRGERVRLAMELRKHTGGGAGKDENGEEEAAARLLQLASGVNGGGEVEGEGGGDLLLLQDPAELRRELLRLRTQCQALELQKRRSDLEVQRLREQVRRSDGILQALGRAAGGGSGGGLLYSLLGFFGGAGGKRSSPRLRATQHPVIQV